MSAHTPGPFFTSCPHGGTIYVEARLRGSTIQEVCAVGPTENPEQQKFNAKLIAAAPELLESLQNMLAAFDNPILRRKLDSDFNAEAIDTARAAIAKARGLA